MAEIRAKLLAVHDPKSQLQVITRIDLASEAYQGPYARSGPDMLVGYNRGYRAGWKTILGAFPPDELEDNSQSVERRPLHGLHARPRRPAQQSQDLGEFTGLNGYRPNDSGGVWNRQGTRYDWTIYLSVRCDPLISSAREIEVYRIMFGSHKVKTRRRIARQNKAMRRGLRLLVGRRIRGACPRKGSE